MKIRILKIIRPLISPNVMFLPREHNPQVMNSISVELPHCYITAQLINFPQFLETQIFLANFIPNSSELMILAKN
jgi:hypothetical protein